MESPENKANINLRYKEVAIMNKMLWEHGGGSPTGGNAKQPKSLWKDDI